MQSALLDRVSPLLGSLGLHGGVLLALLLAARHPKPEPPPERDRSDVWAGNAVEVDAVPTPEAATPSTPSNEPEPSHDEASDVTAAPATTTETPVTKKPAPDPAEPARPTLPRPRAAAVSKPKAADSGHETATSSAEANGASSDTGAGPGTVGAEGLRPGVRSLATAFTRAIPPGVGGDPLWQSLPTGAEPPFTIAIEVDADGHISGAEVSTARHSDEVPEQFEHFRARVVALLRGGLFALQGDVGAGRELFRVTITLSDRPLQNAADPAQLVERGFEPPRTGVAGRAYFTLASGRHFEAKVEVLPARKARP